MVLDAALPASGESFGDSRAEYEAAQADAAIFDVSQAGKIEVSGPEAPEFLHNLCTNDVKSLAAGDGCEAFFCNVRARVLFLTRIYHVRPVGRDALWVDVFPGPGLPLVQHLDRHLIAEHVELRDRTAEFAQFHVAGPNAIAVLTRILGEPWPNLGLNQHMERTIAASAVHIRRNEPLGRPGFDMVCLSAQAQGVWQRLVEAGARPAGTAAWEWLRVESGTPLCGRDMDDSRFVVEVNRPQAISFTKGCYLGQEPIVMARDRAGFVARSLRGFRLSGIDNVIPGAKLFGASGEAGVITSIAETPGEGPIALGYVRRGEESDGTVLRIGAVDGGISATVSSFPLRRSTTS